MAFSRKITNVANAILGSTTGLTLIRKTELNTLSSAIEKPAAPAVPPREFVRPAYVMATLANNISIWLDLADYGVSRGCLDNSYELAELTFITNFLKPGNTFVDVGANIGWFSLHAAQCVGSSGKVVAVEPRQGTMRLLERSSAVNGFGDVLELHNYALGDMETHSRIAWADDMGNPGGTWLMIDPAVETALEAKGHAFQDTPVVKLDKILGDRHIDLIKIDIEGAEPAAMRGAVEALKRTKPTILSEVNPQLLSLLSHMEAADYIDWYRQFGYRAFLLTEKGELGLEIPPGTSPSADMVNVVFVPNPQA
jgi:FkbM family methyltransferase